MPSEKTGRHHPDALAAQVWMQGGLCYMELGRRSTPSSWAELGGKGTSAAEVPSASSSSKPGSGTNR